MQNTRAMKLRLLTLNLWGDKPPLERRMEIIAREIAALSPDIVALQEVREVPGELPNQADTLARGLGYSWAWGPTVELARGGHQGQAILCRFPLVEHATFLLPTISEGSQPRSLLMAKIMTPLGLMTSCSTHLSHRAASGVDRERQVLAIDGLLREHQGELPQIILGDFNATPDHDEIRFLRGRHTLEGRRVHYRDAYAEYCPFESQEGATWASRNPYTRKAQLEPDRRIDYVFLSHVETVVCMVNEARVVLDQPDADGVFGSDHFALFTEIDLCSAA